MKKWEVIQNDCVAGMRTMADGSVDAIVTDPPYELGFMGKSWDASGIAYSVEMWREALRVLKPGGHLLAFSGSRTYHRMVCAIEDAGFEIRDQIMWVYGSGFPKSLDVSKAIDKAAGAVREQVAPKSVIGHQRNIGNRRPYMDDPNHTTDSDIPATDAARQWQGWGTALKPAHEPIVVARKPLIGTVAANVLAHGTGAINVDGCRVRASAEDIARAAVPQPAFNSPTGAIYNMKTGEGRNGERFDMSAGRWPANLIHDGSDEVLAAFPEDAGRFFYCAKASAEDRTEGNNHPTVKPTDLMRYLVRLITPPGGVVLDPFTGSGSTGRGAVLEGFDFIGFDLSAEYVDIARARIAAAVLDDPRHAPRRRVKLIAFGYADPFGFAVPIRRKLL